MNFDLDNIGLSLNTLNWYKNSNYTDIKSAMEIGYNTITSNNYQLDQNENITKLNKEIEILKNEKHTIISDYKAIILDKDSKFNEKVHEEERKYKELENRQNTNNELAIKVAVENKTSILTQMNTSLQEDKQRLQSQHDQKEHGCP